MGEERFENLIIQDKTKIFVFKNCTDFEVNKSLSRFFMYDYNPDFYIQQIIGTKSVEKLLRFLHIY